MEEKQLEILYDHYKDTFENLKAYLLRRNNYSLAALGLILVLSFGISDPTGAGKVSAELINSKIGKVTIDFTYVNSFLLFVFLWITMMYFQLNLLIEGQYKYLDELETALSAKVPPYNICREGRAYAAQYSYFSKLVKIIYTVGFPAMVLIIAGVKWNSERQQLYSTNTGNGNFIFDTCILLCLIALTLLYAIKIHFDDFKNDKP